MKGQKGEHKDLWGARSPRRNPCWLCSGQWEFYLLAAVVIVSGLVGYRYSIIGRDHGIEGGVLVLDDVRGARLVTTSAPFVRSLTYRLG
jgi:hypothetical protein